MARAETKDGQGLRAWAVQMLVQQRQCFRVGSDALAWMLAVPMATLLRYDLDVSHVPLIRSGVFIGLVVVLQLALGTLDGVYVGRYSFGSFEEVAALGRTVMGVAMIGSVVNQVLPVQPVPRSVPLGAAGLAFVLMGAARYAWRLVLEGSNRPTLDTAVPAIVFGAGDGGHQLVTSMLRSADSPYLPVALLDDDPAKRNLRLRGVAMAGTRHEMADVAERTGGVVLVIAIPSASAATVRELSALASEAGLLVRVLPRVDELLGELSVGDVRPLSTADLLGRREIDTDVAAIADYLAGRRVLVTGAGGSIGSELCRQIYRFAPAALIMLDRDESALHAVQLSIHGRALLDGDDLVVADIRDADRLLEVFDAHRPEVVFHAAALKHLPLLEQHPAEGAKTNVLGTLNVLQAAMANDVRRFVNISTDKAADPISVLGHTKRIAERLTAWADASADGSYLSVRFGNVLGSRGSVLTAFEAQIAAGGPVTVTDPSVTRYFMTVEEAVQLVIQAGAVGQNGEALVLDMGEPVRIADVARRLIEQSGRRIEIVYTGLRPGEKMHEVLRSEAEHDQRTRHPLISHVDVPSLAPEFVMEISVSSLVDHVALLSTAPGHGTSRVDAERSS